MDGKNKKKYIRGKENVFIYEKLIQTYPNIKREDEREMLLRVMSQPKRYSIYRLE